MARAFGSPGTFSSLVLRTLQVLLATASLVLIVSIPDFHGFTGIRGLIVGIALVAVWSMGAASFDIYSLIDRRLSPRFSLITAFLIGDWMVGGATLATAASSEGLRAYLRWDTRYCHLVPFMCERMTISVMLAFGAWLAIAISALAMFRVWARSSVTYFSHLFENE